MVSKSVPRVNKMRLITEQQARCDPFEQQQECNGTMNNNHRNANGNSNPSERSSSSTSSDRFFENEWATSSSSPPTTNGYRRCSFTSQPPPFQHHRYFSPSMPSASIITSPDHYFLITPPTQTPKPKWATQRYAPLVEGLHDEIIDLYMWIKPSAEEVVCRRILYNRLCALLQSIWPDSRVTMYGSVATNSFLPSSDIDICIMLPHQLNLPDDLETVAEALRESQTFADILVLDKAAVPIVKCRDLATQCRVDINFNLDYAADTVDWTQQQMAKYPEMAPLLLVLKQYMAHCELNNPFVNGGLPSYALVVMLDYFLEFTRTQNEKNHRHRVIFDAMTNNGNKPLGFLFHYFLFHYAHFDYTGSAISIRRSARPELLPKATMARWLGESVVSSALWITDPVKRDNNVGKGAYNIVAIQQAFMRAWNTINFAFTHLGQYPKEYLQEYYHGPILGLIIPSDAAPIVNREQEVGRCRALFKEFMEQQNSSNGRVTDCEEEQEEDELKNGDANEDEEEETTDEEERTDEAKCEEKKTDEFEEDDAKVKKEEEDVAKTKVSAEEHNGNLEEEVEDGEDDNDVNDENSGAKEAERQKRKKQKRRSKKSAAMSNLEWSWKHQ